MKKMFRLFLVLTMVISCFVKPMGLVASAMTVGIDEQALAAGGVFREQLQQIARTHTVETHMVDIDVWQGWDQSTAVAIGTIGPEGAPWVLYDNGVVEVGAGVNNHVDFLSPWQEYRYQISRIIFTEPLDGSTSLARFFGSRWNGNFPDLEAVEGLENIDTSRVTSMAEMFTGASSLVDLDVSNWDTSNVTDMSNMFAETSSLLHLDVSNWDTNSVEDMFGLFVRSGIYELNVSNWNTSNVTNMHGLFAEMLNLSELDVFSWDVSNVTDMSALFFGSGLIELDLSNWNTSNVAYMNDLFGEMPSLLRVDVSSWDASNAISMWSMFRHIDSLSILTLGENFIFIDNPELPEIPQTDEFTGFWQNVGSGSIDSPRGEYVLTSAELMNHIPVPDTYVWQRWDATSHYEIVPIFDAEGLAAIGGSWSAGRTFVLQNDIELTEPWIPIDGFLGTLDGNGHVIRNLFVAEDYEMYAVGLFGVVGDWGNPSNVIIRNLGVYISGDGLHANSTSGFSLTVGGLAGTVWYGNLDIIDSYVRGDISGTGIGNVYIGGLLGSDGFNTQVNISRSFATGSITSNTPENLAPDMAGGLVGTISGSLNIFDSFARNDIYSTDYAGGLIGYIFGDVSIINSFAAGNVTSDAAGGLVGQIAGFVDVINSYRVSMQIVSGMHINTLGEIRTIDQMNNPDYLPGWCFDYIWEIQDGIGRLFGLFIWLRPFR